MNTKNSFVLGIGFIIGVAIMAFILSKGIIAYKELDRTVVVKGLAEREVKADLVIWPIKFVKASNDNTELYEGLEADTNKVLSFLKELGFSDKELTVLAPSVTDKFAQSYGGTDRIKFRFTGSNQVVVYSNNIDLARKAMQELSVLGKKGITFIQNNYETKARYLFTKLNEIKPKMVEQATQSARNTAQKFAQDSNSNLGKIRKASQGQFSIRSRDNNTEHIKKVRVVSTVEYYLVD